MTNWYIENNKTPVLGMAVLMLGGAIENLQSELKRDNYHFLNEFITYSHKIETLYRSSLKKSDKDNLIMREYARVGKAMLEDLYNIRIIAHTKLSASLKIIRPES